ncbi:hypothetical protein [Rhizobium rhizogenes]|uniref:hypothetical protein n=2 Tax=Rhizobium rhizogenes TaxID=359 RepID=UPI000DDCD83E|nr:hypothetical protein [Rhizobium rhizogenes]NTG84517.1 hypothetical protein [Rhizobium rhizogenes]NTI39737.1 hypothetical protein [Rhizobium rhizogenes]WEO64736.1 hypothetical protein G6L54_017045 [Rhizobium rhizogenes]
MTLLRVDLVEEVTAARSQPAVLVAVVLTAAAIMIVTLTQEETDPETIPLVAEVGHPAAPGEEARLAAGEVLLQEVRILLMVDKMKALELERLDRLPASMAGVRSAPNLAAKIWAISRLLTRQLEKQSVLATSRAILMVA